MVYEKKRIFGLSIKLHDMRKFAIIILSLTVGIPVFCQMRGYKADFHLSEKHFCDTIDIEYKDGQVYVPVTMNGQRKWFNLDTGSSQGMVYLGASIGYWTELGNVVSRDANGLADTVKVVRMPDFRLSHLTVSGYVASMTARRPVKANYDAIIGFDLFHKGICAKIDVRHKRLILTDNRHAFDREQGYTLKYKLKWFVPYILVSPFMRHVDEVLFDTGAKQLYTMNKESFDRHAYKSKNVESQVEGRAQGHLAIGVHGTEERSEVAFLHLDRLKWDEFSFTDVRAITTQGTSRIGGSILQYGTVIINPFERRLTFAPYNGKDSVRVGNRQLGVAFTPHKGRAGVGLIFEKSAAYQAGLREGDIILKIDGRTIPTFQDFLNFRLTENQCHVFTVFSRNGKMREVAVEAEQ
uniref:PDZ domain-containing protein n=1 Tax=Prevotella sp. GTC17262 TaxID=3236797 RepID=A0AB33JHV5_9BACT